MKATPLIINWHDQNAPVYSAHFEPNGKGRLATAGGDNHVRIWKVETDGLERKVDYLSTLSKHNQAVNVVRWAPKGTVDPLTQLPESGQSPNRHLFRRNTRIRWRRWERDPLGS